MDYKVEGEYPAYGNNDDRVDQIAVNLVETFMAKLRNQQTYRNARPTQSILTITSNVVYGKKTGPTPDGRREGAPFGPELIPFTAGIQRALWPVSPPLPNCPMNTPKMEYPTPSPLCLRPWARMKKPESEI